MSFVGHIDAMLEAKTKEPRDQEDIDLIRRIMLYVGILRVLCFALAIWIGFEKQWSGLAWFPIAALLIFAAFGFVTGTFCTLVIRLVIIYDMHRLTRKCVRMSATNRERLLARMSPELRERLLLKIKNHLPS